MDIIADPLDPRLSDAASVSDDTLITPAVWARLQCVKVASVHRNTTASNQRRGTAEAKPGDMPATDEPHKISQTPVWTMGTYRAWDAARPGKGAGAGRPKGSGQGERPRVRLPIECPHCHHAITPDDLGLGGQADGDGGQLATAAAS